MKHSSWFVFTTVVTSGLVLGTAHAEPNHDAIVRIDWAIGNCSSAISNPDADPATVAEWWHKYASYRDDAFKADPSIKTWDGFDSSRHNVQEWLKKCEPALARGLEAEARANKDTAKELARKAFWFCIDALEEKDCKGHPVSGGEWVSNRMSSYREQLKQALETDPSLLKDTLDVPFELKYCETKPVTGTRKIEVEKEKARCDAQLPKRLEQAKADEKTADARSAAEDKKTLKQAKGDRARLLNAKGFPNYWGKGDSDDDVAVLQATWWRYYDSDCEVTLHFRGNKVMSTEQTPPKCFTWR